jgi:uncharacterized integral membrane protein
MLAANIPWAALAPIFVVLLALQIYCVVDVTRADVRYLPRWGWALVVLLANPIGGIVYLLAGRRST